MSRRPEEEVCTLFDVGEGVDTDNITSQHICPLKQEPPVTGVYFDIPNADGTLSDQVFERSEIYRWIATLGNSRAHRNVSHPINQQFIFHPEAWSLVHRVSNELQVLLQRERLAMGLVPYDGNPLTAADNDMYNEAMRIANDRR